MTAGIHGYTCKYCGKHVNWSDKHDCRDEHEIARLRAEVATWRAKFADEHIAHGVTRKSLEQTDAEVERLTKERDRCREALEEIAAHEEAYDCGTAFSGDIARKALGEGER